MSTMPNEQRTDYGVVHVQPWRTFQDPDAGVGRDERRERDMLRNDDWNDPVPPPTVAGWPRVHAAIFRDGFYRIEAKALGLGLTLNFCPNEQGAGTYTRRGQHNEVARGRTVKIVEVEAHEPDRRVSMLIPFEVRYWIKTVSDTPRHGELLVWLVGLNAPRRVVDDEVAGDHAD
jgi:hypothetical protein